MNMSIKHGIFVFLAILAGWPFAIRNGLGTGRACNVPV